MLIVDEEPGHCAWMRWRFAVQRKGFEVYTACRTEEAFKIVDARKPEVYIIELYHRREDEAVNGIDVLKKAKTADPNAECLMTTFFNTWHWDIVEAYGLGARGMLRKTTEANSLMPIITKMAYVVAARRKLFSVSSADSFLGAMDNLKRFEMELDHFLAQENLKRLIGDYNIEVRDGTDD